MSEETLEKRVLRRLVYQPESLSRNQNFHAFDSDDGRRVLRLAARIRSLRVALRSAVSKVSCLSVGADFLITIDDPEAGVHRETLLTPDAFAILFEDRDSLAAIGADGLAQAAPGSQDPKGDRSVG
jgi:hypothetical protein